MDQLEHATFSGGPVERGRQHGEAFADEIERNAEFYLEHFAENGVDEATARRHADQFIDRIADYNESYAEEMRGVAAGSGVPLEEVTLINVRHTILYSAYATLDEGEPDGDSVEGCTSFGLEPEITANGHTYLGQNWDWKAPLELFLMEIRRDDAPDFLALTEAGMVGGKFGLNEHGIGVVVNGLTTPEDGHDPYRKPAHVRGREILDAERLDLAIDPIVSTPRPTSRNYVLGRPSGEIIDVETAPDAFEFLYPEDHVLTHTNHFQQRHSVESTLERRVPHSVSRGRRIRRLFEKASADGPVTEADIKDCLRDHVGRPRSVCRHVDEAAGSLSRTNASVIMDLDERRFLITDGPPCATEYEEYLIGR